MPEGIRWDFIAITEAGEWAGYKLTFYFDSRRFVTRRRRLAKEPRPSEYDYLAAKWDGSILKGKLTPRLVDMIGEKALAYAIAKAINHKR